ncbi:hypothetical protein K227x_10810 [Rubripirellula lacrimiformis]|uniref:Zinc-finger domain-containing protein n=1 Tax=Rubripirellula lacrimiformis TaxID=1930273 RepID=A0A517N6E3_9BACT|nr:hypothetical protein [Rubripirellula lacrimiformis]QDT02703.1 hypothetical protein K227x_10810 [Rubripirellula lacrimiformis]
MNSRPEDSPRESIDGSPCDAFEDSVQRCLDQRQSPLADERLVQHAQLCSRCHQRLQAWTQVQSYVTRSETGLDSVAGGTALHAPIGRTGGLSRRFGGLMTAAVVAGLTLTGWSYYRSHSADQSVADASMLGDARLMSVADGSDIHLAGDDLLFWWQGVQQRDWIQQTMPAVRSVREGVAPVGRSLRRAVTILATGSQGQTS